MSEETLARLYHKDIASRYPKGSKERDEAASAGNSPTRTSTPGAGAGAVAGAHAGDGSGNNNSSSSSLLPGSPRRGKITKDQEDILESTFHPKIEKKSVLLAAKRNPASMPVEERLLGEAAKAAQRKKVRQQAEMEHGS
jgi:hypothetical protein